MRPTQVRQLEDLAERIGAELYDDILPFWSGPAVDHERGGWMGWLTNDLRPDRSRPKGLVIHSRILWTFSTAYLSRPEASYRQLAERAFGYLIDRFWDARHGGAYWLLDDGGQVLDDSKRLYGQAFCLYGLTAFHHAFGSARALGFAEDLFGLIERHGHDGADGGYLEACRRDWSAASSKAWLGFGAEPAPKTMNTHLHLLEAYASLRTVWPSGLGVERPLRELIEMFHRRIVDARTGHLRQRFDRASPIGPETYRFGHDIEASWLLCEAAEAVGDAALTERTHELALRMAAAVLDEGVAPDGGLFHEGRDGEVIDRGRECWPQAEAVVGFLNAYELGGDPRYLEAAAGVWRFIETKIVDRAHGEWFWRVGPDGEPDQTLPKVSEWKGPYHPARACLEALRRLERIRRAGRANDAPDCAQLGMSNPPTNVQVLPGVRGALTDDT